jgi:hypothetical protein
MTATSKQEKLAALFEQATIIPVLTIERRNAVPRPGAGCRRRARAGVTLRPPVAINPQRS